MNAVYVVKFIVLTHFYFLKSFYLSPTAMCWTVSVRWKDCCPFRAKWYGLHSYTLVLSPCWHCSIAQRINSRSGMEPIGTTITFGHRRVRIRSVLLVNAHGRQRGLVDLRPRKNHQPSTIYRTIVKPSYTKYYKSTTQSFTSTGRLFILSLQIHSLERFLHAPHTLFHGQ